MNERYRIIQNLYITDRTRIDIALDKEFDSKVILKSFVQNASEGAKDLALRNECDIALGLSGSMRPQIITDAKRGLVFVREYVEGISLAEWMQVHALSPANDDLAERLQLAIRITEALEVFHNARIIHKDLTASNIIISPATAATGERVVLIDYELASRLNIKSHYLGNPERLEGTLAYISPEQTGRMNRVVDYRSDLYSLGVTLYELFTGKLPFDADSAIESIYAHIAKIPVHPTITAAATMPGLPVPLGDVILKLLAKNAEDRYQSAFRLRTDLEHCLQEWRDNHRITPFELAQSDIPYRLQIPQKLYGRMNEREQLLRTFGRAAMGQKMLTLVSGYSGIGKTALIYDIHTAVTEARALFVSGKFEHLQRNVPYFAWTQAFTKFVELLLTENQATLQRWRENILSGMGGFLSVITQIVPALEAIVGVQSPPPALPVAEAQNRFNFTLRLFVKTICSIEHPMVMFIDDWQWADAASLNLLKIVMTEPGLGHLLMIGAYRDNEVSLTHPFITTLAEMEEEWRNLNANDTTPAFAPDNVLVERITLDNLKHEDVFTLLSETLMDDSLNTRDLAVLVHEKTSGNPFFVHRFIENLYEEAHIHLETVNGKPAWVFNAQEIRHLNITDNVVELLTQSVRKLPQAAQNILRQASCVGDTVSLEMLAVVSGKNTVETEADLWEVIEEGLMIPQDMSYRFIKGFGEKNPATTRFRFAHDRIREAVYASLDEYSGEGSAEANNRMSKEEIHRTIALYLLKALSADELEKQIFDVANHCNASSILLRNISEHRASLVRVNTRAGARAKAATAFATAFRYFDHAIRHLETDDAAWSNPKHYADTLQLYINAAETAYLCGEHDAMNTLVEEAIRHTNGAIDTVKMLQIRVSALFAKQDVQQSLAYGIEALAMLGVNVPAKPSKATIILEVIKTKRVLGKYKPADFLHLPIATDEQALAIIGIISHLTPTAFFLAPNIWFILTLKSIVLTVRYGVTPMSASAFAGYGLALCGQMNDVPNGIAFGQLAGDLFTKYEGVFHEFQARVLFIIRFFIDHWHLPYAECYRLANAAYQHCLASGEVEQTALLGNVRMAYYFLTGESLSSFFPIILEQRQYCRLHKQQAPLMFNNVYLQYLACLQGKSDVPYRLHGEYFDFPEYEQKFLASNNRTSLFSIYSLQGQLLLQWGQYQESVRFFEKAIEHISAMTSLPPANYFSFVYALALLMAHLQAAQTGTAPPPKAIAQAKTHLKKLQKYATFEASSYGAPAAMIQTLIFAASGKHEKAILSAQETMRLVPHSAAWNQRYIYAAAYKLFSFLGMRKEAEESFRAAYTLHSAWGAESIAEYLLTLEPHLAPLPRASRQQESATEILNVIADNAGDKNLTTEQTAAAVETIAEPFAETIGKRASSGGTVNGELSNQGIDVGSIIKGTQIITGELNLDVLLKKMLLVMAENAGAERGALVIERNGTYSVEVEIVSGGTLRTLHSVPMESYKGASLSVLNYVQRTRTNVVMDNAQNDGRFRNDSYIKSHAVRSLLCSPMTLKGELLGVLYLENNLVTGAFTPNRVEVLNILSAQAAISIENARFYADIQELNRTLEQKVVERTTELASANANLHEKNEQLAALNIEKNELMGILAHDLKNPIGAVRGYGELIQNQTLKGDEILSVSGQIVQVSNKMLSLVKNLLDVNHFEEGGLQLHPVSFDITPVVEAAIDQYRSPAAAKNIMLHFSIEAEDCTALADERALIQILDNLVSNAVKYSPFGKNIWIRLKSESVNMKQDAISISSLNPQSSSFLRVEVQDEGPGISPEDMQKLFGKFARLTAQPTGGEHSTGLGLSIVKKMVEAMNGRVWCESELGKGATFIVELPLVE